MPHALIIDDDPFSAEILERLLTVQGIDSITVFEPTQVTTYLDPGVNLVFLDLEMPKMNGYEVLKLLQQTLSSDVPIVAYTVHANEADVAWEKGFHSFLGKPLSQDHFPTQLARILKNESVWDT
jgi:CheY-like chemotaxis protein